MLVQNYELPQIFAGPAQIDSDSIDNLLDELKEKCIQQITKYAGDFLDKNDARRN